jgi:hypothetical protein
MAGSNDRTSMTGPSGRLETGRRRRRWAMNDMQTRPPKPPPAGFTHTFWRVHRTSTDSAAVRSYGPPRTSVAWGIAPHDRRPHVGQGARRDPRVPGRRAEHRHARHERVGRGAARWRNLEAHPDAVVRLAHQHPRTVHARAASGEEHHRLWQRWAAVDEELDAYAAGRSAETAVVVFEPRTDPTSDVGKE